MPVSIEPPESGGTDVLALTAGVVPLVLVRNLRARRYVLRVQADGSARVTVPRGGTLADARAFARRHAAWFERALARQRARPVPPRHWLAGHAVLFRGEACALELTPDGRAVRLGGELVRVPDPASDLRPFVERHLWRLAARELPPRVLAHAQAHGLAVRRVSVRNQRSRWGSCSRTGTISLNWRLVQTPDHVVDYIILHELMHLREMNHSARYWREVARVCPEYETAERWLKANSELLR